MTVVESEGEKRRAEETRMSAWMPKAGGQVVCGADADSGKRKRRERQSNVSAQKRVQGMHPLSM